MVDYPISGADIQKYLKNTKLLTYKDIKNYDSIESLLHPHNEAVIFYRSSEGPGSQGHWTAILKNKYGIEHFDAYGTFLDDQLNAPVKLQPGQDEQLFKILHGQNARYLTKLLSKTKYPVSYNHHQFQRYELSDGVRPQTCGRWVICRLLNKTKSLRQFKKAVDKMSIGFMSPDDAITHYIRVESEQ